MKTTLKKLARFLTNQKAAVKITSSVLVLVLLFFAVPTVVYAEIADAVGSVGNTADGSVEDKASSSGSEIKGVLYEDLSKREESVKHFHLEDGSFVAAQYNYPVHVADEEGNLVDIDNSLSSGLLDTEYSTPDSRIKFAKKITGNSTLFTLHDGDTKLSLSLAGAKKGIKGSVTNGEDAEESTELQKMMNLEKLSSSILYKDILDGVDLEYVVHSLNVKENIIVKEQKDLYSYSFELKLNGLSAELLADGDIAILDADGKEKYRIPAPVVYDSAKTYAPASASAYTLTNTNGGKYTLTVTVDSLWMNSEDRAFPVTIDPAIISSSNQTHDTCLDEQDIYAQYGNSDRLPISFLQTVYWKVETLPVLPPSAYIYDAKINYYVEEVYTENYVAAYPVTGAWSESTTFGNMCDGDAGYNANKSFLKYFRILFFCPSGIAFSRKK